MENLPQLKYFKYNPSNGITYALIYADYFALPESLRLFYYDVNVNDCTNFTSQCIWAAYGGYVPGTESFIIKENKKRIDTYVRQSVPLWFGSQSFVGSTNWCNVEAQFKYITTPKSEGPNGRKVAEGTFKDVSPLIFKEGDIIQMVVKGYNYGRFGHSLYVTQAGNDYNNVRICCHTIDRVDSPLSEFVRQPDRYPKMRIIRLSDSYFKK